MLIVNKAGALEIKISPFNPPQPIGIVISKGVKVKKVCPREPTFGFSIVTLPNDQAIYLKDSHARCG